jgi:hypothetical protein
MRSFITCTLLQSIIRMSKSRRMIWAGHVQECIEDIGGKARRKETTGKTKT